MSQNLLSDLRAKSCEFAWLRKLGFSRVISFAVLLAGCARDIFFGFGRALFGVLALRSALHFHSCHSGVNLSECRCGGSQLLCISLHLSFVGECLLGQ